MKCRVCKLNKFKEVLSFGNQYLAEFRDEGLPKDRYPVNMVMCMNCTLVQLRESTPSNLLYTDNYGYYSGVNNTIRADLRDVVGTIPSYTSLTMDDTVIDIGSNDATLLKYYPKGLKRYGFDPVSKFKKFYNEEGLTFINTYFNKEAFLKEYKGVKPKVITAISCFYDLENPHEFVQDVKEILHPEGVFVIEQNYLATMIENLAFDNIVHEHIEYYTLKSLEYLLRKHFLKVVDVKVNNINGGAFRTYIKHMDSVERMRIMEEEMKLDNQFTYVLFSMKVKKIARQLHDFLKKETEKGKRVYVYGASTRGNTLLQTANIYQFIEKAVERNPVKYGKRFLGIPIISEEEARKFPPDYALILPWFFAEEIIARDKDYKGKWIIPLPELKII